MLIDQFKITVELYMNSKKNLRKLQLVKLGQYNGDFTRGLYSAALTFSFNVTGQLCDVLGI